MKHLTLYELLQKCDELPSKKEKIEFLRKIAASTAIPHLTTILKYAYDDRIKFLLPTGNVDYTPSAFDEPSVLKFNIRKLYLFVEGGHATLTPEKRLKLFSGLLGQVSPNDAILLLHMKDKKLPFKTITAKLVKEALPFIFE